MTRFGTVSDFPFAREKPASRVLKRSAGPDRGQRIRSRASALRRTTRCRTSPQHACNSGLPASQRCGMFTVARKAFGWGIVCKLRSSAGDQTGAASPRHSGRMLLYRRRQHLINQKPPVRPNVLMTDMSIIRHWPTSAKAPTHLQGKKDQPANPAPLTLQVSTEASRQGFYIHTSKEGHQADWPSLATILARNCAVPVLICSRISSSAQNFSRISKVCTREISVEKMPRPL